MKTKGFFLLVVGIGLLCNTCEKDTNEISYEEGIQNEALSDEEVYFLDNLESIELSADDVILSNGANLKEFLLQYDPDFYHNVNLKSTRTTNHRGSKITKDVLLARLSFMATYLTTRDNFRYPEGDVIGEPAQHGLAYSYGCKEHQVRKRPSEGECEASVYGLDCAGLIYQLFHHAGVRSGLWHLAEVQRKPETLRNAIQLAFPELEKLKIEDLGSLEETAIENGDIIYFLKPDNSAKHIGIVLNHEGELWVAQSNGTGKIDNHCETNYGPDRGPRFVKLNDVLSTNMFGDRYGIVRIDIEEKEPPDFNLCLVMLRVYGYYHEVTPTTTRDYESDNGTIESVTHYPGSFTGRKFTGSYTGKVGTVDISGSITAYLNDNQDVVDSLIWVENWTFGTYPYGNRITSCKVENIPKAQDGLFKVEGDESCEHILNLKVDQISTEGLSYSLKNRECTWNSIVYISFYKE